MEDIKHIYILINAYIGFFCWHASFALFVPNVYHLNVLLHPLRLIFFFSSFDLARFLIFSPSFHTYQYYSLSQCVALNIFLFVVRFELSVAKTCRCVDDTAQLHKFDERVDRLLFLDWLLSCFLEDTALRVLAIYDPVSEVQGSNITGTYLASSYMNICCTFVQTYLVCCCFSPFNEHLLKVCAALIRLSTSLMHSFCMFRTYCYRLCEAEVLERNRVTSLCNVKMDDHFHAHTTFFADYHIAQFVIHPVWRRVYRVVQRISLPCLLSDMDRWLANDTREQRNERWASKGTLCVRIRGCS